MAVDAATIWEFQAAGANTGGAGFADLNPGTSVDYSQQAAAELNPTDLACASGTPTTLTSATGGFTAAMEGNVINITAGTNFTTGWYQITGYTDTNTVTLDRIPIAAGEASSGTGYVGGANDTLTTALLLACEAGNIAYLKGGNTFTLTADLTTKEIASTLDPIWLLGYDGTRGTLPTAADYSDCPTITGGAYYVGLERNWMALGIHFTSAATKTLSTQENCLVRYCFVQNTLSGSTAHAVIRSDTVCIQNTYQSVGTNGESLWSNNVRVVALFNHIKGAGYCVAGRMSCWAFNLFDGIYQMDCVTSQYNSTLLCNTFYNCTTGIHANAGGGYGMVYWGNIVSDCTTAADYATEYKNCVVDYNDWYDSSTTTNLTKGNNDQTVDPQFAGAGAGNFAIGTNLQGDGSPGAFPGALSTGYLDCGAVQREEAGGGGTTVAQGLHSIDTGIAA